MTPKAMRPDENKEQNTKERTKNKEQKRTKKRVHHTPRLRVGERAKGSEKVQ